MFFAGWTLAEGLRSNVFNDVLARDRPHSKFQKAYLFQVHRRHDQ